MKPTLDNLRYPGLFAYLGEKGYVDIFRTNTPPHMLEDDEEDTLINIVLEGADANGERIPRSEYDSIESLFATNLFLEDLEYLSRGKNGSTDFRKHRVKIIDRLEKELNQELGVKVAFETPFSSLHKIGRIKLGFAKRVWADIANKKGKLLPPCCASISSIRDRFIDAQREDLQNHRLRL